MFDIWKSSRYLKYPLHTAIVTIVQKSSAYDYGYYLIVSMTLSPLHL